MNKVRGIKLSVKVYDDTSFLDIIDTSKPYEQNISKVWHRNVFFILGYGLVYVYFFLVSVINRLCRIPKIIKSLVKKKQYVYVRKVSNKHWVEMHNTIVDSNIWRTMWLMLLFSGIAVGKLIYHFAKIFAWIVKYVFIPIIKWVTIVFGILCISNAIATRNQSNN